MKKWKNEKMKKWKNEKMKKWKNKDKSTLDKKRNTFNKWEWKAKEKYV